MLLLGLGTGCRFHVRVGSRLGLRVECGQGCGYEFEKKKPVHIGSLAFDRNLLIPWHSLLRDLALVR